MSDFGPDKHERAEIASSQWVSISQCLLISIQWEKYQMGHTIIRR